MRSSRTHCVGKRKTYGPVMVVTEKFREDLQAWLDRPEHSARKLAKIIGCDPSNFSQLLNNPDDYKTSELVLPISVATGIALPLSPSGSVDQGESELLGRLRLLRDTDNATFEAIIALINARLGKPNPL